LAALSSTGLAACGSRQTVARAPALPHDTGSTAAAPPTPSWRPEAAGLDAVIDISDNVSVSDFRAVRRANILAVIHKATEGGDWFDRSYNARRAEAETAGLLWGGYHFGTRQYSGIKQATTFLNAVQPGPSTLLALDFEPNDYNPNNTMSLRQAEEFVHTVYQATGRYPVVYTHAAWANGERAGRRGVRLIEPVSPTSILARCDLWLADPREQPELPYAWANKGWRLWQYVANESAADAAYGGVSRAIPGITHCDRNLFAGDANDLYRFWQSSAPIRNGRTGV
jgi:lysozyme